MISFVVRWCSTAELTPLRSMFFRKVVEGKEDAIWKVKSDFRHLSIRKHFNPDKLDLNSQFVREKAGFYGHILILVTDC